jgi:hypothetical protein
MRQLKTKYNKMSIKGKTFDNLTQACKHFKVGYSFISSRIHKQGMSIEEAFSIPFKIQKVNVRGIEYKSLRQACDRFKIKQETVYYRMNKGWSLEESLEVVKRKRTTKCKGLVYVISNTVNSKKYIGITTMALSHRFSAHKKNAAHGKNTKFCRAIRSLGKDKFTIKIIKKTSCRYELPKLEIKYIKKYNSIDKGYNTASGGGGTGDRYGHEIKFDGQTFVSNSALARYLGLSTSALKWRLANNLPLNEKIGRGGTKGNRVLYRGKIYKSVKHLGTHLGLSKSGIHYRLKMGYCLNGPSNKTGQKGYYIGKLIQ